jgi:deazaflavin-dependent oxidoreductase (nitroreductase family)
VVTGAIEGIASRNARIDRSHVDRERILAINSRNIAEFRASGGRLAAFGDAPVLLLTTVGAKTGQRRTSPMMYLAGDDPGTVYVFASNAGAATDPVWLRNVVAHPNELVVEIGGRTRAATGEVLPEPERIRVFDIQAALYPGFAAYQRATARPTPVVALRLGDPAPRRDTPTRHAQPQSEGATS